MPFSTGASLRDRVHQTPADMYKCPGDTAELSCLHTIPNYNVVLWYKRSGSGQLQLLGYMFAGSGFPEPGAPVKMAGNADTNKTSTLTFETLGQDSSAVYFCAASLHSAIYRCSSAQKPNTTLHLGSKQR